MAAGPWTVFNKAKEKIGDATIDLDGHTFKAALCGSSQALAADFTGTSTDCRYADLTDEAANGNGYTTGGETLGSVTWTESAGTVTFDCANIEFDSLTKSGLKYAVIYSDTATNKDLLAFCALDTDTTIAVTDGTLTIAIHEDGVFTLS